MDKDAKIGCAIMLFFVIVLIALGIWDKVDRARWRAEYALQQDTLPRKKYVDLFEDTRDDYERGWDEGYEEGYEEGYQFGFDEGYLEKEFEDPNRKVNTDYRFIIAVYKSGAIDTLFTSQD